MNAKVHRLQRFQFMHSNPPSIWRAQQQLFYVMLGGNILKGLVKLTIAISGNQTGDVYRALFFIISTALLIFLVKRFPRYIAIGIHFALLSTIFHVYHRVFTPLIGADILALQYVFLTIVCSFYGLNKSWGTFYTLLASGALFLPSYLNFTWPPGLQPYPHPYNDIYILINIAVILLAHIYFHGVLYGNINSKNALNEKLAEAAKTKTDVLSTVSHELRTPLNSVIGIASLLIQDNKDVKQKEQLDALKFSAESLLALINNILDINKLESGRFELESIPFSLPTLLNSISKGAAIKAEENKIGFTLKIDEELNKVHVIGDPTRLSQILYNLVGNAVKFTKKGGVTMDVAVLQQLGDRYTVRFKVSDTGIGISKEQQRLIFEPFAQASVDTTRKFGGTGLGLSIVKQLVEMQGSQIQMESTVGEGTCFFFDLQFKTSILVPANLTINAPDPESDISSLRILLAEDNIMNVYFMKQLFKRWNITADFAENGEEVLAHLAEKNYDVVLMDMHMPVMDGAEATRIIRQLKDIEKATVYIIALTASVSDNVQNKVKECGMDNYLHKPFQLDELKDKLQQRVRPVLG
jgi:signal transduction histidine kinase/CheY-like chemotaxis protein